MKALLLIFITSLFFTGCSYQNYSYIHNMPVEPAFTKGGQAKIAGAVSFNHAEAQASVSPIRYIGLSGSYFRGTSKQWSVEYGGNLYIPFWKKRIGISVGQYFSEGSINITERVSSFLGGHTVKKIYTYNTAQHLQYALYFNISNQDVRARFGILYKKSLINFKHFYSQEEFFYSSLNIPDKRAVMDFKDTSLKVASIMAFAHIGSDKAPIYGLIQLGLVPTTNTADNHPRSLNTLYVCSSLVLNIGIGLKLD